MHLWCRRSHRIGQNNRHGYSSLEIKATNLI
jgi:hypothetical protein